tara:strand:+ start:1446 stop:1652 length:207 start_codon:yes stop_codon:yes gene_type:complete
MKTNIGQHYIIRDKKHNGVLVEAEHIGARRMTIKTGEHTGEVLMVNQYEVLEKCEHNEAAGFLAMAWA